MKQPKAPVLPPSAQKPAAHVPPALPRNPLQPATVAPGKPHAAPLGRREEPHAVAPAPVSAPAVEAEPVEAPAVSPVEPMPPAEALAAPVEPAPEPPPVSAHSPNRTAEQESEPHWLDPMTGFPDTARRRDGSFFNTPRA